MLHSTVLSQKQTSLSQMQDGQTPNLRSSFYHCRRGESVRTRRVSPWPGVQSWSQVALHLEVAGAPQPALRRPPGYPSALTLFCSAQDSSTLTLQIPGPENFCCGSCSCPAWPPSGECQQHPPQPSAPVGRKDATQKA